MYAKPMILPLDGNGQIYALQDEAGNMIGTGTREVCEVLLYIITKPASPSISEQSKRPSPPASQHTGGNTYLAFGSGNGCPANESRLPGLIVIVRRNNDELNRSYYKFR